MNIEQARFNMIEQQIRTWEVLDPDVLSLLAEVKREEFVPESHRALAFVDTEVPLPGGRQMLAPKLEARLLQELAVQENERVLLIGAGTGYVAALLARSAKEVVALDSDAQLLDMARANLVKAGARNVTLARSDGMQAAVGQAPFDVILLAGSVAEVPGSLIAMLRPGGRLIGIVGHEPIMQATLYTRVGPDEVRSERLFDTVAQRLAGFAEPTRFRF